jgi:hypothetical protein
MTTTAFRGTALAESSKHSAKYSGEVDSKLDCKPCEPQARSSTTPSVFMIS